MYRAPYTGIEAVGEPPLLHVTDYNRSSEFGIVYANSIYTNMELHYEGNNEIYNMMAHLVAKINDDRYKINRSRSKPKEQLLYNLQMKYMALDEEINKILSGKKGARVKSLWRTIVKAIVKNFLNCWELSIRDNQQLRLYKRKEMINIIK